MIIDYVGVKEINGSLIVLDNVENASFEEMVDIRLDNGTVRHGRIVQIEGKKKKRFCSDKCRMSWWNHHRDKLQHRNPISIKCKCCRKVFISSDSSRKYCSMNCYNKTRCNT